MEDAASGHRELVVAFFTVEKLRRLIEPGYGPFAARAFRGNRPAKAFQKFPAEIVVRERGAKIDDGHRRSSMDEKSKKAELKKVPMRKLLAAVKQGVRKQVQASKSGRKPLKP